MPIEFSCPGCNKTLRVADTAAGKKARCPDCGQVAQIPSSSSINPASGSDPFGGSSPLGGSSAGGFNPPPRTPAPTPPASQDTPWSSGDWAPSQPQPGSASNPYAAPNINPAAQYGGMSSAALRSKVSGPATGLQIAAGIGIATTIIGVIFQFISVGMQPGGGDDLIIMAVIQAFFGLLGLVKEGFIIHGANQMKQGTNHSMAMTAAILAVIPCFSGCCLIELPIGIWALVVLNDAQVKSAFRNVGR